MKNDWHIYTITALLISFLIFIPKSYSADTNTVSSGTVTIEAAWDETDSNGQIALQEATGVTLLLYPEGADSGDYFYTVPAIVTGNSVAVTMDDLIRLSISCQINGAITRGTV